MDLWTICKDQMTVGLLQGELMRIVESQEQVATNSLVDNLQEQEILEQLIETTKPKFNTAHSHLHYLLSAPFRYPPLPYGSRFGARTEPSLFYGSQQRDTLLCEAAFYRFIFWQGMSNAPPSGKLVTQHTLFSAKYHTTQGLRLHQPPCAAQQHHLTDPMHYTITQQLGTAMRQQGIEAFEYISARDPQQGINVGLFTPAALACTHPQQQRACLCETTATTVSFYGNAPLLYHHFQREMFEINGVLPQPAL